MGNRDATTGYLLKNYDSKVLPVKPDIIWIIVGTNNYWQGVPQEDFTNDIKLLKAKCVDSYLIISTSSVGSAKLNPVRFDLSRQHANLSYQ
jgi:hypothetical protein